VGTKKRTKTNKKKGQKKSNRHAPKCGNHLDEKAPEHTLGEEGSLEGANRLAPICEEGLGTGSGTIGVGKAPQTFGTAGKKQKGRINQ